MRTSGAGVFYFDHLPSTVTIDYNLVWNASGGSLVYVVGKGSTSSFSTLKSWIGRMSHGIQADPKFMNLSTHDYRLAVGSPAVNHAAQFGSETTSIPGHRPGHGSLGDALGANSAASRRPTVRFPTRGRTVSIQGPGQEIVAPGAGS